MVSEPDGAVTAVEKVLELGQQGYRSVLDADISSFLTSCLTKPIMRELSDVVPIGNILGLVEKFLRAGVMEGGETSADASRNAARRSRLTTAGQHRSQCSRLASPGTRLSLCGYADDFVVLCRSEDQAKEALALVEQLLADRLGLA